MRTLGVIGGMSWESTALYYRLLNSKIATRLGGLHSAKVVVASVNFDEIVTLQKRGAWDEAGVLLSDQAQRLERAGADCVILAVNTMHRVADQIAAGIKVPFLHIADAAGQALSAAGCTKPLVLGTRHVTDSGFYLVKLADEFEMKPITSSEADRQFVHDVIYDEFSRGVFSDATRAAIVKIIERGRANGADSVLLACTELPLLIRPQDSDLPVFDTSDLHIKAAAEFMLAAANKAVPV